MGSEDVQIEFSRVSLTGRLTHAGPVWLIEREGSGQSLHEGPLREVADLIRGDLTERERRMFETLT
ncbi:MAG: hypothetical protein ABEN55_00355 [Bradymonadaceae bacterium]